MTDFLSAVIRLSGVRLAQADLESRLGVQCDRYEVSKRQVRDFYAQLDIDDDWEAVGDALRRYGPVLQSLRIQGDLQNAVVDIAFTFLKGMASMTRAIPAPILFLAGSHDIGIEVSIYSSSD